MCQGQPCYVASTTAPPVIRTTTPTREMDLIAACRTGWSDWFNTHQPKDGADPNDIEPIPDRLNPVTFLLVSEYFQEAMDVSNL